MLEQDGKRIQSAYTYDLHEKVLGESNTFKATFKVVKHTIFPYYACLLFISSSQEDDSSVLVSWKTWVIS